MTKIHLLDTSVLIDDPEAPKYYCKNYIPIEVIEELDNLKTKPGKTGQQARMAIKFLESWKNTKENKIYFDIKKYNHKLQDIPDNRILAAGIAWKKRNKNCQLIIVSQDFNLRLKAKIAKLLAIEHKHLSKTNEVYSGIEEIEDHELLENLYKKEYNTCPNYLMDLFPNQCLIVKSNGRSVCARKIGNNLKSILNVKRSAGLDAKNQEQALALDLLLDTKLPLVTLVGVAGTGKTICTLAAGLQLIDEGKYEKIVIYKPIQSVGNDVGYLPGMLIEKLTPWMGSIFDNLENLLCGKNKKNRNFLEKIDDYIRHGILEFNAISHIRGRSINNAFILIDEMQNTSEEEAKTILTRVGYNTKIVLTGDIEQIDRHDLSLEKNGLTHVIEKFKKSDLAGHLTLLKGERSALASEAAKIL